MHPPRRDTEARPARSAKELANRPAEEDVEDKERELRFGTAMCSLSILRYLTDYLAQLPLSLTTRMMNTSDMIMALVPLLDNPPWVRQVLRILAKAALVSRAL